MASVLIGSECSVVLSDISIVISLSSMLDKSYIIHAIHEKKCMIICGGTMLRTAVILRDGTVMLTPVTAKTIRERIDAVIVCKI